jgi:hypothetical protein
MHNFENNLVPFTAQGFNFGEFNPLKTEHLIINI